MVAFPTASKTWVRVRSQPARTQVGSDRRSRIKSRIRRWTALERIAGPSAWQRGRRRRNSAKSLRVRPQFPRTRIQRCPEILGIGAACRAAHRRPCGARRICAGDRRVQLQFDGSRAGLGLPWCRECLFRLPRSEPLRTSTRLQFPSFLGVQRFRYPGVVGPASSRCVGEVTSLADGTSNLVLRHWRFRHRLRLQRSRR